MASMAFSVDKSGNDITILTTGGFAIFANIGFTFFANAGCTRLGFLLEF